MQNYEHLGWVVEALIDKSDDLLLWDFHFARAERELAQQSQQPPALCATGGFVESEISIFFFFELTKIPHLYLRNPLCFWTNSQLGRVVDQSSRRPPSKPSPIHSFVRGRRTLAFWVTSEKYYLELKGSKNITHTTHRRSFYSRNRLGWRTNNPTLFLSLADGIIFSPKIILSHETWEARTGEVRFESNFTGDPMAKVSNMLR